MSLTLLGSGNPKTLKGEKRGFLTFILHLAPAWLSGWNVCPNATPGCAKACLNLSGRFGPMERTQAARVRKTKLFFQDRDSFMDSLVKDIGAGIRQARRQDLTPVFRLNGTSDLRWENAECQLNDLYFQNVFSAFPSFQFYDYTKLENRNIAGDQNYHLTFSRADGNEESALRALAEGFNVAAVFSTKRKEDLPKTWRGFPVFDGDESDLRFLDPPGHVIGLRAKGKARQDQSGFVIQV